ncbi:MAG: hypothetical protein J5518_04240 [Lachnospiraceae bacterium]|nr:hypothetical protein [Lachnospiraceae bacterium]
MPKPKKIKKKKSFMFTTKHQSENGVLSCVIAVVSLLAMISCIIFSFTHRGEVPGKLGGVGMFAAIGNIIGIVAASISLKERDIFIWVPRIALIVNIVLFLLWGLLVFSGMVF